MDSQKTVLNVKRACHTFPPHWKSMVLTRNGLHKIISAARQSKKRQQTEPYWVGTVRTVSETGQTTQRNDQRCLSRHFVLLD